LALEDVRNKINEYQNKSPVAAVIIEPILSEGGDKQVSSYFA